MPIPSTHSSFALKGCVVIVSLGMDLIKQRKSGSTSSVYQQEESCSWERKIKMYRKLLFKKQGSEFCVLLEGHYCGTGSPLFPFKFCKFKDCRFCSILQGFKRKTVYSVGQEYRLFTGRIMFLGGEKSL